MNLLSSKERMFPHKARRAEKVIDRKGTKEAIIIKGKTTAKAPKINVLLI